MRLLRPEEMPGMIQGTVCRQSRLASLLYAVAMLTLLVGVPGFLIWNAALPWWAVMLAAGFAVLVVRWLGGNVISAWRSGNWLLRISPDGLWINLRWYLNHEFPPGRTVVHLPYERIACVRQHVVKRVEKTSDGTTAWTERSLELQLTGAVPEELRAELAVERLRQVTRSHLGGLAESRSRYGNSHVTVPANDVIRIAWRNRFCWVTPPLGRTLRELKRYVAVGEPTLTDFSNWQTMSDAEVDRLTLQLVESGDKMGAIKLLTARRGYSTTDARLFVEELTAKA
jgi:hypothetical protein